jgi:hypothetical protein
MRRSYAVCVLGKRLEPRGEFLTIMALLFPLGASRKRQTLEIFDVSSYAMNGLIDNLRDES